MIYRKLAAIYGICAVNRSCFTLLTRSYCENTNIDPKKAKSLFEFTANDIDGNSVSLEKYRGFVTIVVNVATKCGLTNDNYEQLNGLFDKFEEKGLRILAFPCNQFASQEPGTEQQIKEFMNKKGVRFDAFAKIDVNGKNTHPVFEFLKNKQGGTLGNTIKWNFTKFLINKEGIPIKRYGPKDEPNSMEEEIKKLL
ncbi:glutathione peroxidase-like isoform X1 [Leptotrombidium deliense]|uniref:Glutathione peroxidase n=1 Tax=Leptotrombidium deliense TaxID=299467 RepID=A0A443SEU5_9ACAR|nr:glutathione peroxidase-like isoform X1 [Leptotrombidium deliense]